MKYFRKFLVFVVMFVALEISCLLAVLWLPCAVVRFAAACGKLGIETANELLIDKVAIPLVNWLQGNGFTR